MRGTLRITVAVFASALAVLYLGDVFASDTWFYYRVFTKFLLGALASSLKLATLGAGVIFATRAAAGFGAGNEVSTPWRLVACWLGSFFVAQSILSTYQVIFRRTAPLPSAADAALLVGYGCLIAALVSFLRVYRATGFAVGLLPPRRVIGVAVSVPVTALLLLVPIARAEKPVVQRAVNVLFPLLDLTVLSLVGLLLHTLLPMRGGRVFRVWSVMLVAFTLVCAGDMLFAYFSFRAWHHLESLVNLVFLASYAFGAVAAWLQYRALRDAPLLPRPRARMSSRPAVT